MRQITAHHRDLFDLLIKKFTDNSKLSYDNFICDSIDTLYDGDEKLVKKFFELISPPWRELNWNEIQDIHVDSAHVMSFVNEATFIHAFPSLLNEMLNRNPIVLIYMFVVNHINLDNVYRDWELNFYLSLDEEAIQLVRSILMVYDSKFAKIACESYWH
jgi:hypothetical protein